MHEMSGRAEQFAALGNLMLDWGDVPSRILITADGSEPPNFRVGVLPVDERHQLFAVITDIHPNSRAIDLRRSGGLPLQSGLRLVVHRTLLEATMCEPAVANQIFREHLPQQQSLIAE